MADDSADIFVKFMLRSGAINGESTTEVGNADLFKGFKAVKMFEIDSFSFGVSVGDDSEGAQKHDAATAHGRGNNSGAGSTIGRFLSTASNLVGYHGGKPPAQQSGQFQPFRKGGGGTNYKVSLEFITITRPIDKSFTELLKYCISTTSFERVSVVKRKAAGTPLAGQPYLRLDFVGALIQEVTWTNDEPIKEVTKLITRATTVRYKPQLFDGTLGAARVGFWSMVPWEKECDLQ